MRVLLLVLAVLAVPSIALAKPKPKIAVAPLAGDAGNKVAQAVVDALAGKDFAVVGPKETKRELGKIGAPEELDTKDVRKLAQRMGVVAIIDGKVGKAGKKRSLRLEIHRRGKPSSGFTIEFKNASSDGFRKGVRKTVLEKLDGASEDTDEEDRPVAQKPAEDDKRETREDKRETREDKREAREDKREAREDKRPRDEDAPRKSKKETAARDDGEDDERAVRKRKSRLGDDERTPLAAVRVGAGPSVAQRRLSYTTRGGFTQIPPPVTTTAAGARIAGELYPFAFGGGSGGGAGLGFAASYDKSFGLKIQVPGQTVSAPINQSHYAVGARYRIAVGQASSIALGVDYAKRTYIADRSGLMAANLDTPDFDYTAVAPGAEVRAPLGGSLALFAHVDGMLMLETGPVTKNTAYGAATVYGVEGQAGFDLALAKQIALRLAVEYSQMSFSFSNTGMLASSRDNDPTTQDVMGAVDRYIGAVATLELVY